MSRLKAHKSLGKRKRDDETREVPRVKKMAIAKKQETSRPEQTAYNEQISMMDSSLLADNFAKALKKHSSDSTALELEDKHIPSRSIRDTTAFESPHVAKHLSKYLETFSNGRDELSRGEVASPHTLIITSSGIRAADLAREVRPLALDDVKVAKLFAKHMKINECITFMEKAKINIGIGTPQRPKQLIERGVMKVEKLRRIVIDGSYVDDKKRTIFDMAEVLLPLVDLLNINQIKSRLGAEKNSIEVLVF